MMGIFYMLEVPAFIDDIPIDFILWEEMDYNWNYIKNIYEDCSFTCFFAMACYLVTFTLSIVMFFINKYVVK